ncbi:MAG: hypothetical protein P4L67_03635 [Candidatus Pacebacteria bacterium]|nr:hypothetical protein [Candidatus Paceibacterota bacterium]
MGDTSVGKSCLVLKFTESKFRKAHEVTIGVEFGGKLVDVGSRKVKLQIWDTVILPGHTLNRLARRPSSRSPSNISGEVRGLWWSTI